MAKRHIAEQMWARYYVSTEEFDRTLPGHWSPYDRDCWMPHDKRTSMRHALGAFRLTEQSVAAAEIPLDVSRDAREYVSEQNYATQKLIAKKP